jgi:polyisoprenyl-phosphate glycosyltransferase
VFRGETRFFHMRHLVSIVIPAFNEALAIDACYAGIVHELALEPDYDFEIIFVNDGSTDHTVEAIRALAGRDGRVGLVDLSRNFGKEAALTAGLDHARGDAVVVLDADLQDPPSLIREFIAEWRNGYDVVYAQRTHREAETWLKKLTAKWFYRIIGSASDIPIPADTGDCRLMSRRATDALLRLRERHRFMKGLFAWVGYPTKAVRYRRNPRVAGDTKFNYWRLWNLALEGITSFTTAPLKIATYLGMCVALLAFLAGAWIIFKTLYWGESVPGYPTLMVSMLFLGGVQIFFIGVLGEYLGRIYNETKGRPLYLTKEIVTPWASSNGERAKT